LGEYGNTYKPGCVIRGDRTIYEDHLNDEVYDPPTMSREYSFFYPPDNGEIPGTDKYRECALQDYQNMENLNNSQWTYAGIIVKTVINTDMGISDTIQNSLWGIEDHFDEDSKSEMARIIEDLKEDNKADLLKMGFSSEEIDQSLNGAEIREEW
jgi:hypothetical protein